MTEKDNALKKQLHTETAKIPFNDLQRFFATGQAIFVTDEISLIDTAVAIAKDEVKSIQNWMQEQKIAKVTDTQALEWVENDTSVWAVVVKPWVLIQLIKPST